MNVSAKQALLKGFLLLSGFVHQTQNVLLTLYAVDGIRPLVFAIFEHVEDDLFTPTHAHILLDNTPGHFLDIVVTFFDGDWRAHDIERIFDCV